MEQQATRPQPKFILGADSRPREQQRGTTQKRPRLVLTRSPTISVAGPATQQAAALRTQPTASVQAVVSQHPALHANSAVGSIHRPILAPPGSVPRPLRSLAAGGYQDRVVHVFCKRPAGTGPRKHSVGRWRRGRIVDFRQQVVRQGLDAAVDMIHVAYMHEAAEASDGGHAASTRSPLPAEEWMDLNANHDLRFELAEAGETLLEARAAPRFGGWPEAECWPLDTTGIASAPKNVEPIVVQPPRANLLLAGENAPVAVGHSATAVGVAGTVATAGEKNITPEDGTDSGQSRGNDVGEGYSEPCSDSDLDLDFLADELSAHVEEMPAQPGRVAVHGALDVVDLT